MFNRFLLLCLLALLAVAVYLRLGARWQTDELLRVKLRAAKAKAEATLKMKTELERLGEIDRRLQLRKLEAPPRVRILDELTRRLPDDFWIASLQIDGEEVRITGHAPVVAAMIGLLDASSLFGTPSFQSPVTQEAHTDKERFSLSFAINPREVAK